ncbi:RNA polymerase sigma factor SigM [Nocardioides sp.]|uniref:RNA polymerase sigma factor SigM n=1 Tax=Nocardioides sp. TaxID=35761 RepID=UPI002B2706B1|nr:RNA polymerase sigma factor SigM [Nocardioides sp.]
MTTPEVERSDAALLAAHVAGDHEAFGELFARHRDRLWAVALRTMSNPDDAADGLQDGMVAAYRRAASYRGEAQVTTWLHRVVVNACLDRLRAMKVRRAEPLPDDLEEYGNRGSVMTAAEDDPAETSVQLEQRRQITDALATLAPDQRAAIVLVDLEGYPVAEAAQMLGCAVGTVKSRCSRGRKRLAVLLADLLDDDPQGPRSAQRGNPPGGGAVLSPNPPRGPPDTTAR